MRLLKFRPVLVPVFAVAVFVLLSGFEPSDITYDECKSQKASAAVCTDFSAEGAGSAKNVILFIGDGMGIGQTYAGRVHLNGPDRPLAWEKLPHQGLLTTCSIGAITDSAAAGTALATGHKTSNGTISQGPAPGSKRLETIVEQVRDKKATGIVTTTHLWHATPAVFASHVKKRGQSYEIARQMVEESGVDVMMGGGSKVFLGSGKGPDLIALAMNRGYQVALSDLALKAVDTKKTTKLLGVFSKEAMTYETQRQADTYEPHLSEMTEAALEILGRDPRGFFLMIEGGRIDHASHVADVGKLLGEMAEFDKTINLVLAWAESHPDTLVIITADHETGGSEIVPGDYGPGDKVHIKWTSKILFIVPHSSQQVPIYGVGPNAGAIKSHMDNTEVYCVMKNAFGI